MSNVLSRMIARTNGAISPVQPVLTSRYESTRTFELPVLTQQETIAEPPQVERPHMAEAPHRAQRLETDSPSPTTMKARWEGTAELDRAQPLEIPKPKEIVRTVLVPAPPPEPGDRVEIRSKEIRTEIVAARAVGKPSSQERESVPQQRLTVATGPGGAPSPEPAGATEPPALLPGAPAEVKVTIGTVEVRLTAPPRPAVLKGAPCRVSLDDYLRRRNGSPR